MVVGIQELSQQLLPTKVFYHRKVWTSGSGEERCRMCGKITESVPHNIAGCGALAQTLYLARHNKALKILFFKGDQGAGPSHIRGSMVSDDPVLRLCMTMRGL